MFSSHPSEPVIDQRGLPDTGPCNDRNDIYILICPCSIQEGDILLSTENIASVTGNLATEISAGPSLAGGLRVPTREAVGGVLRSL